MQAEQASQRPGSLQGVSAGGRRGDKRALIIEAAARIFARRGYGRTVVAEIAAEAGVGKGTIYEYFESKEALFFAVFQWLGESSASKAHRILASSKGTVPQRLVKVSDSLLREWVEMRDFFTLVMEYWSASATGESRERFRNAFRAAYQDFRLLLGRLIREGMAQGEFRADIDPESVAAALVGTWDALLLQAWFDEAFDPLKTAQHFLEVVMRGLARPDCASVAGCQRG